MSSNFELLKKMLYECDSKVSISNFIKMVKMASLNKKQINVLASLIIETKKPELIYQFALLAEENYDIPVVLLANGIIAIKDADWIYKFALNIPNAPIELLVNGVVTSKNAEYIYNFACDIPTAPIELLTKAVIDTKDAKYIYKFAFDIPNSPIELLAKAVIDTKDAHYIYAFAVDVPNAPLEMLVSSLMELNAYQYLKLIICNKNILKSSLLICIKIKEYIQRVTNKEIKIFFFENIQDFLKKSYQNGLITTLRFCQNQFSKKEILKEIISSVDNFNFPFLQVYYEYLTSDIENPDKIIVENLDLKYLAIKENQDIQTLNIAKKKL